ncbi:putative 38.1 kDa protein [Dendrobium catenatum]|uniref:Putative 38.1 kDa protein n=1 Tax=Dendrobium catenatum TaxID=906689 RepID=A0A2I0VX55_9ASPA|nr:putative 38.1 kDa protein [Dendrobium catenatum]
MFSTNTSFPGRFQNLSNQQEVLACKYKIRLSGVDGPEVRITYEEEVKQVLVRMRQGKCLKIHVYNEDIYVRSVWDVYCNDIIIQEQMLKRCCASQYVAFDRCQEFTKWQKETGDAR